MANQTDLDNKVAELDSAITGFVTKLGLLLTAMTDAFSRFLAKLAAGGDPQLTIDKLNVIVTKLHEASASVDSAIAQAQTEAQ